VATPGFAFVFGINLGYAYYPKYRISPAQTWKALRLGVWLLVAAVVIQGLISLLPLAIQRLPIDTTGFFTSFYSVLPYYALALVTVRAWFRLLVWARREMAVCAALMLISYVGYRASLWLFLNREQTGFLQLCRLLLVAKFNYFNMSIGVLGGLAAGIHLRREAAPGKLSPRALLVGVVLVALGLTVLYGGTGSLQGLHSSGDMGVWRWLFYSGAVLIAGGLLNLLLERYTSLPKLGQKAVNLWGVLGQCTLPVIVLHILVLHVKAVLVLVGLPEKIALALPLALFVLSLAWMMRAIYRMYYGSLWR
jgi:hypothetical protein